MDDSQVDDINEPEEELPGWVEQCQEVANGSAERQPGQQN